MPQAKKLLVTGGHGFLGHHFVPVLEADPDYDVVSVKHEDYDITDRAQVDKMLADHNPDMVVHMAAKVGGIIANKKYAADFFYDNIMLGTNAFDASFKAGVEKFITFIGGCSYPAHAPSPIAEEEMWNGYPQPESASYSVAKKVILTQSECYRKQHDFNSIVLIPGNVYGEFDNFDPEYSHVIPAMIRRFVEATEQKVDKVVCFGSGKPTRDFVYAEDVARLIPWFIKNYDSSEAINISSGTRTSIKELAETVAKLTAYEGEIEWDTSKPDGQMDKIFGVERLHKLGLSCDTSLEDGLKKTIDWYIQAKKESPDILCRKAFG